MKIKSILFLFALISLTSCKNEQLLHVSSSENQLFKVSILYANGEDKTFDMDYYQNTHMPMVASMIGDNLQFFEIDKGVAGRAPGEVAPYIAVGYFYIKDVSEYQKAIDQNREAIINDIKNYTNIIPTIQVSEINHIGFTSEK